MRATKIFTKANVIKIRFMADNGFGSAQIADAIGSTPGSVRCMCSKMEIKLGRTKGSGCSAKPRIISKVLEASFLELVPLGRDSEAQIAVRYARGGLPPCARRRVHDYIAAHLDQKITNDALAQVAGLSTSHFYTVFKQTEGVSPHRYVLQYRVRRTQQLLASTEMSPAEIADAVGFSNQSHCIQSFRKIVGVTPGNYRCCCLQDSAGSLYGKRACMARA
jgi:AraC-like DNA-binding protein